MGLDGLDWVEGRLEIFDEAVVVAGNNPVASMGVLYSTNCSVMSLVGGLADFFLPLDKSRTDLLDGFEVERHSIPESKFAAAGSGDQTSSLGGPFHHVDRMLDLVQGRVLVLGGDGVRWPMKPRTGRQ